MNWYPLFAGSIVALWAFSSPRDRNALRIVLVATLASFVLTEGVTRQIVGAWKLVIPGTVEILTIAALFRWSRNLTGYIQAALLTVAWAAHLFCYMDIVLRTDLVYSRYETIIQAVAVGQLLACHDTLAFNLGRLHRLATAILARRRGAVCAPSLCAGILPDSRPPGV